jgi:hypothetical protein
MQYYATCVHILPTNTIFLLGVYKIKGLAKTASP